MVEIIVDNSYSQIKGLKTDEFRAVRKLLSYESDPQAAYFSNNWRRTKYLIDKNGYFPTGLLYRVLEHLAKSKIDFTVRDKRKIPKKDKLFNTSYFKSPEPYVDQVIAVDMAQGHHRGGIIMPTGTGKSFVIALIALRLQVRTLVVVPTLEIKKQLQSSLNALYGNSKDIVVENIDSKRLKALKDFDCLIIDECHHVAAKTYQDLNKTAWTGIYYRFFLTATFYRNQDNEQLLFEGIAGEPIFQLSYSDAVKRGYIVPVEAYYYNVPKQATDAYTYREVYNKLVVHNEARNVLIGQLLVNINADQTHALCLVKEIKHGEILSQLTGFPFANGQDETSREYINEFNKGEIKILIGTTGVLGEGVDTKPAEFVVIAGLGKAKSAFMQNIGRGARRYPGKESCKVILFRDASHKFTLRHFKEQYKILKDELGIKAEEL